MRPLLVIALTCVAPTAGAQTGAGGPATRQEMLLQQWVERREHLTVETLSTWERRLLALEKQRFPENVFVKGFHGIRPVLGGMPAGSGLVAGRTLTSQRVKTFYLLERTSAGMTTRDRVKGPHGGVGNEMLPEPAAQPRGWRRMRGSLQKHACCVLATVLLGSPNGAVRAQKSADCSKNGDCHPKSQTEMLVEAREWLGETADAGSLRHSEAFRAIVARMSGAPGLGMERLAITIDRYTTDHDARLLLAAQKSGGESAWLDAIRMMHKGVVSLTGGRQWMIHAVRATAKDTGRSLVIIAGPLSSAGVRGSSQSPDNRFGVIELQIDEAGRSRGRIMEAARIWLDESGTLQVDSSTGTFQLLVEVEPAR